jgi:hypothetical protein
MRITTLLAALLVFLAFRAVAEPAAPEQSPLIAELKFGVLCAVESVGKDEAPDTLSGFINLVDPSTDFDWPGQRVVPATIGLGFGVRVQAAPGVQIPEGEIRVYRPGMSKPESWMTEIGDAGSTLAFFSFDTEPELMPGLWIMEGWDQDTRLFRVEFDIVPDTAKTAAFISCEAAIS